MNDTHGIAHQALQSMPAGIAADSASPLVLKAKGACWYCNAPLDNIRRFCNKTCAVDYQTEQEVFK